MIQKLDIELSCSVDLLILLVADLNKAWSELLKLNDNETGKWPVVVLAIKLGDFSVCDDGDDVMWCVWCVWV